MHSVLFETVIQITGDSTEDVDPLSRPLEPINFTGTPFHESTLFEQVLREMATVKFEDFASTFIRQLKNNTSTDCRLSILYEEAAIVFEKIIRNMEEKGYTVDSPFAIKEHPQYNDQGKLRTNLYSCSDEYKSILINSFFNKSDIDYPKSLYEVLLVGKDVIDSWVDKMIINAINKATPNIKSILKDPTYQNTLKQTFFNVYSKLPQY